MAKSSYSKIAVGTVEIAVFAKPSVFAIAAARLGIGRSAQAGGLRNSGIVAPHNQRLSLEDLHRKVEALGHTQKAKPNNAWGGLPQLSPIKTTAGMLGTAALVKIAGFAIVIAMLGVATAAQAGSLGQACTTAPQSQWLSVEALRSKVEALGYKVQKAKLKNACGELYTLDKNGNRVELFVDPVSGTIVGQL